MEITTEQLKSLEELQNIEAEAVRIEVLLKDVDEKIETIEKKYKDAESKHNIISDELDKLKSEYKKQDSYLQDINDRLEKSSEYLKTISSQKEYKVLLRETDENKKKSSKMQDEMIELLDEIEKKEVDVKSSTDDLVQLKATVDNEVQAVLDESVEERQALEIIQKKKEEITPSLTPELLKIYSNLLKTGNRKAVIKLKNNTCTGCFVTLPPQFFIEIRKGGELFFCPQCQRIVFYEEEEAE